MSHPHFQTIVVGVDFSSYSKIVVKQALELAKEHKAQLVFVHTLNSSRFLSGEFPYVDVEKEFILPLTDEVISFYHLKEIAPGSKVVVKIGRTSDGIVSAAQETEAPLIIVGHKGTSTLMGRFFIGSTAEQLALHSPFPVWIHRGRTVKSPKKILIPCDFSKRTTRSLETAKYFNGSSKSKYEFFHVEQKPVPILDANQWKHLMLELRKKEDAYQREFHAQYPKIPIKRKPGEPAHLIARESRKFDLIAMAPHNREGLFSGFGSITAKVVRTGNTPVLITH